jgi:hypothetical protein
VKTPAENCRLSALIGSVPFSEQADIVPNAQQAFEERRASSTGTATK